MSIDLSPFEDKLVVINYTEADYYEEGDAVLLYQIKSGRAVPILGVMQLGEGVIHNLYQYEQVDRVIALIGETGEHEVFSPLSGRQGVKFFEQNLGYFDLTEDGECWCEFKDLHPQYERYLSEHQILVYYLDPETYELKY